jgi:glycosyltransferase involved in cell wall biosynthesis
MNVLLLNISLGNDGTFGGIESHSDILASALIGRGHNVIMGCRVDGFIPMEYNEMRVPAKRVRIVNSGDLRAMLQIVRISSSEKIDVIIANHGREYWPASIAAMLRGVNILFVRHQVDRIRKTTRWLIAHHVGGVVAVSEAVRDAMVRSGVPPEKITVVHNSIPLAKFNAAAIDSGRVRKELGLGENEIVIGTVGKLHRGKGVFELLQAVHQLRPRYPSIKLLFVGDGPERSALEHEAGRLSMQDRVVLTGVRKDVERMYAALDIFVLASSCEEAFGMVLIEAMAMERPVVATAVGGIPEIVQHEVNGLLVRPGDSSDLARAISRYLDDECFRGKMALRGRGDAERRFSDKAMGENFERVLLQVCEGKKKVSGTM